MFTADQLFAHAVGDYIIQSDWMASEKTKKSLAAFCHAFTYSIPFLFITNSIPSILVIMTTHFIIDRWRIARYVCWLKNFLAPNHIQVLEENGNTTTIRNPPWKECETTGYPPGKPLWMSVWLMIIADNLMHVACNALAVKYL